MLTKLEINKSPEISKDLSSSHFMYFKLFNFVCHKCLLEPKLYAKVYSSISGRIGQGVSIIALIMEQTLRSGII